MAWTLLLTAHVLAASLALLVGAIVVPERGIPQVATTSPLLATVIALAVVAGSLALAMARAPTRSGACEGRRPLRCLLASTYRCRGVPAYVVALIESISDVETYKQYVAQVEATLAPFGGRFIARKPDPETLEGTHRPSRAVILEFANESQARAWHASPSYQPVMRLRQSASLGTLLLLPGYSAAGAPRVAENDVHYVEMVSDDVATTRRVCEDTFGWRFEAADPALGGALVATLASGARCAIRAPMHAEEKLVTRVYLRVPDVAAAVKRAEASGARVGLPPMEIPGYGTIAIYFIGGIEQGVWQLP